MKTEEIKQAALDSSRGYSTENYDSFIEGVEWVLNKQQENVESGYELLKTAISVQSLNRSFFKPSGQKLVIGHPMIDQVKAELLGMMVIGEDYNVEFIAINETTNSENIKVKNWFQIGIKK